MTNLELWEKVARVPQEHLKQFTRAGGFRGTAIKPIWAIKAMTEQFGPCGEGWFIDKPDFQLVPASGDTLVYCTVSVWVKGGQRVYGVGGDWVVRQGKGDDEAFKKAYTDALTNALVKLGVGADIHMGLWDGNKYVDEAQEQQKPQEKPKAGSREPYTNISMGIRTIRDTGTNEDLTNWYKSHVKEIETWNADWRDSIMSEFTEAREYLNAKKDAA